MSRVLVVEDNPTNQMIMMAMLRKLDVQAVIASNLQEARRLLEQDGFALLLMDSELPDGDGIAFTREYTLEGGAVPVVAVTGAGWKKNHRAHWESAGMVAYLEKPFTLKQLASVIRSHAIA